MSLLLDTHVVIWWLSDDPLLDEEVKAQIDAEPEAYVSPVSVWEITMKQALGKIKQPADLPERVRDSGFRELPVTFNHAIVAGRLPMIHRDPFDRMLVAQAQTEALALVTRDPHIQKYEVQLLVV
jgi:PIN domain nuclease of toxin-antitoxin system